MLTYAQIDCRARAIAVRLGCMGLQGQRVALAFPPGLEFITGFLGCLYGGCAAVPTCLPHRRTYDHFRAIVADADARLVLSTGPAAAKHQAMVGAGPRQGQSTALVPWVAAEEIPDALSGRWEMPPVTPQTLAMLQYTSGSTSRPKGVMLSHANLIHNTHAIRRGFEMARDRGVFWLPHYHDMGLVGGILGPMLAGLPSHLMAPALFLQHPIAWLAAITKCRATISGGPNFAYDLCVRRITPEQRASLDLSSWSLAFVGAEPIQAETLERFATAFGPCGFNKAAFYPCYGLAEATLMVTGARRGTGPSIQSFHGALLTGNEVEPIPAGSIGSRRLVSCGTAVGDARIEIVNPQTCAQATPGHVGEIWVAGSSIGQGYWRQPEMARRTFNAHLSDTDAGPFLRTGDLGFLLDGELFVVGRLDDLLVVRGLNHHPQDLEATARTSHQQFEAGLGAAFLVEERGAQRLVLVQEVTRNGEAHYTGALSACLEAMLVEHGLQLDAIVLVRLGTIPRTSSGKVQRRDCRRAYLAGDLAAVAEHPGVEGGRNAASPSVMPEGPDVRVPGPSPSQVQAHAPSSAVLATVCQHALALGGAALSAITPDTTLAALGLDSLQRAELAATLEKSFACRLPDADFGPLQSLGDLALAVQAHLHASAPAGTSAAHVPPAHYDFARFPEFVELKRYERMLKAVTGSNPYFRVDQGRAPAGDARRSREKCVASFCDYDYLGLAQDPEVAAAAKAAIDRYGTSAGASRLVWGEKQVHRDLEQALAGFLGTPAAIAFVSGHATNVTTLGHLMGPEDLIVHDVLAHNSIIQGAQLSGATRRVFAHNDAQAVDALLSEVRPRYRRVLIAIEGVYSMDGDFPDLPRFVEVKKKHRALMLVDEAHSLGTLGVTGRGIGEHWNTARADVDLWMGTLSKSLGSCGGYIAGSAELVEYLGYTAPGFVYSVGLSPPNAAAALAALTILQRQPQRVSRLRFLAERFLALAKTRGINTGASAGTPVIPVIVGNSVKSLRLSQALFDRGIGVQPILHPAVPEQAARLRLFVTINHSEDQIRHAIDAIAEELARL